MRYRESTIRVLRRASTHIIKRSGSFHEARAVGYSYRKEESIADGGLAKATSRQAPGLFVKKQVRKEAVS